MKQHRMLPVSPRGGSDIRSEIIPTVPFASSAIVLSARGQTTDLFTYIFAFATVAADASDAAVDHLDAAEHQLHHPHGQQYGEQNHVPHHCVFRWFTHKEASSDEPPHEPDLQGDMIVVLSLPIGEEQQQVGDHADERCRQQDEAHQAGTFPHKVKELISKCLQARDMAYCPYSRFPVGAAILTTDGAIITDRFVGPCGACRQVLMEFGSDWIVYLTKPDGSYKETSLLELLPLAFSPAHLAKN
ncbi:hypothetical protein F7725_004594 [Dissostichus mawsoni]|uniref:Cytidine deaminase n=1 Tax=Dissostichus mawsoni TaxID=36200 RepID=A0A7J5XJH7_DISMA|nr:hypothetical protein F7725_004594 [Dissostichus mawsoni]